MAVGVIAEILGDELLQILSRARSPFYRQAGRALDWLREVSEPPRGLELRSPDGSRFTGAIVVQGNQLVLAWLIKHPALPAAAVSVPESSMGLSRGVNPGVRRYGQAELDPDDPRWDRDWDPYHISR